MHGSARSGNRQLEGTKRASQVAPGNIGNFSDICVRRATYISGSIETAECVKKTRLKAG